MARRWFRRLGPFAVPVRWEGWLATVLLALFCSQVFVAIDRHSHSASDTLYGVFPYFGVAFLLHEWLGSRHGAA